MADPNVYDELSHFFYYTAASGSGPGTWDLPPTPADLEVTDCQELELDGQIPARWEEDYILEFLTSQFDSISDLSCNSAHVANEPLPAVPVTQDATSRKRPNSETHEGPPEKALKRTVAAPPAAEDQDDGIVYGMPHVSLGLEAGKWWCSCWKQYAKKSSLDRHLQQQTGKQSFACSICERKFARKDICERHEVTVCGAAKVPCPCCQKGFRKDYLTQHLASPANVKCQLFAEATQLKSCGAQAGTQVPDVKAYYWAADAGAWELDSARYPEASSLINVQPSPQQRTGWEPSLRRYKVPQRPIQRRSEEACDLCFKKLGTTEAELVDHHQKHIADLVKRTHWCDLCELSFAHHQDLDAHLSAAKDGYCGLNFNHASSAKCPPLCTGHHPPGDKHHSNMQLCLENWELCQLHAHRATIVRILADRIAYTQPSHISWDERRLACMMRIRGSKASFQSFQTFRSAPAKLEYKDDIDIDALAADFGPLTIDTPVNFSRPGIAQSQTEFPARPVSAVLPVNRDIPREVAKPPLTPGPSSYVNLLSTLRSPVTRGTKSSRGRQMAAQVRGYLSSSSRVAQPV